MHRGRAGFGTPDWGRELKVEFLWSGPIDPTGMGSGGTLINNGSLVLKLTYGTQSVLFMGDAEGKERDEPAEIPRYAIAHHGSETSSTFPCFRVVDPAVLIVSSRREANSGSYLPDPSTLRRYCAHNPATRIYCTDQNDAAEGRTAATDNHGDHMVIRTNGARTEVRAYSAGQPWVPAPWAP